MWDRKCNTGGNINFHCFKGCGLTRIYVIGCKARNLKTDQELIVLVLLSQGLANTGKEGGTLLFPKLAPYFVALPLFILFHPPFDALFLLFFGDKTGL